MGSLVALRQTNKLSALGTGASVLGETLARIPVGGKIRSGIKVLTSAAAKNQKAVDIYERGVAAGKKWDDIERTIKEACNLDRSPLTPKNTPYFTAKRGDFAMPEVADLIVERYGEDRGDGRRLYRFPVVLPLEQWLGNMPHGLKCYTKSELVYWSDYGPDGTRYCHTRGNVEMDPKARRARRVFGGRPVELRADNDGRCNPDSCQEYQAGKCKLSGGLVFYIPGIPGSSAIQLPTTSFYSLSQWRQQMEMVAFLRGRVSGMESGKPVFYLAKRQEEISMIDPETGKPKKVKQWLVKLEADIDMSRVIVDAEAPASIGAEAARMLTVAADVIDQEDSAPPKPPQPEVTPEDIAAIKKLRSELFDLLQALAIDTKIFAEHAERQWGEGWSHSARALESAKSEVTRAGDDIAAYRATLSVPF